MKLASSLLLLTLLGATATVASANTLEGRVVNGTTGQAGRADRIELIDVAAGMDPIAVVENVDGTFQIADLPATSAAHLLLRVSYGGMVSSQSLTALDAPVEVKVFETTRSLDAVTLGRHHVLFQRDGEHMLVTELLEYDNRTDPPTAIAADALPMRLWLGNPVHGQPTASVGSGQMPVTMPLVATESPDVMAVEQALAPGTTRVIVRYNFEYHEGQNTWQGRAVYPTEDRRVLVSPLDVKVVAEQMVSTESPLEGFASWSGLPIEAGAQWSVSLTGGSAVAADGHDHPTAGGGNQAITQVQSRPNRMSNNEVLLMLGMGAVLVLALLVGLSRTPALKLAEDKQQSADDDKRRRISRVADRYVSGEITREQFEHDRDAILGGKHVGHHQNGAAKRVETASH